MIDNFLSQYFSTGYLLNKKISGLFPFLLFTFAWFLIGLLPAILGAFTRNDPSAILGITHLVAVVIIVVIATGISVKWALMLLAIILPWQPVASMPLAHTLGENGIKILVATKEVYAVTLLGLLFLGSRKNHRWAFTDIAAMLFATVYILYMVVSPASFFTRLVSFREGFMIIAFYFVGRLSGLDQTKLRTVLQAVVVIAILVALFGYTERFILGNSFWDWIGADEYTAMKFGWDDSEAGLWESVPKQWYTYMRDGNGNKLVRRMVGPVGEPTSFSRYLAFSVLILIFIRDLFGKHPRASFARFVLLLFLGGALVLSFGRGGMVIALGGGLLWLFAKSRWVAIMSGVLLFLLLTSTTLFDVQSGSNARHLKNLTRGFEIVQNAPMGNGLGTSGQLAVSFGGEEVSKESKVSESYFASLAAQMGLPGLGAYFLFMVVLLLNLYVIFKRNRVNSEGRDRSRMALLGIASIGGMFVTSALANSAVAPISAGLPLLFAGAVVGMQQKRLHRSRVRMLGEGA